MNHPEEALRNWIRKAESDFKVACDELATEEPATDAVCFHLQQCVEKYLKAYLLSQGAEIPKTHNLALLLARCKGYDPVPETNRYGGGSADRLRSDSPLRRGVLLPFPTGNSGCNGPDPADP
ncbi:MAG: HEPN domain-containing protein [Anaerolineae bacterium]